MNRDKTITRARSMLGRIKGESIEALEKTLEAAQEALAHMRGGDVQLPGPLANRLHSGMTSLGKAVTSQQRVRTIVEVLSLMDIQPGDLQEDDDE